MGMPPGLLILVSSVQSSYKASLGALSAAQTCNRDLALKGVPVLRQSKVAGNDEAYER